MDFPILWDETLRGSSGTAAGPNHRGFVSPLTGSALMKITWTCIHFGRMLGAKVLDPLRAVGASSEHFRSGNATLCPLLHTLRSPKVKF